MQLFQGEKQAGHGHAERRGSHLGQSQDILIPVLFSLSLKWNPSGGG